MRRLWVFLLLGMFPLTAWGQGWTDSFATMQRDSARAAGISFERILNTFLWNGSLLFKGQLEGMKVDMEQRLRSRLIRTEQISIQDEYEGKFQVGSEITHAWGLRASAVSHVLSDARAVDLAKLAQHQLLGGFAYSFNGAASTMSTMAGVEINSQENERDQGLAYSANLQAHGLAFEDIEGSVTSAWSRSFLGRRKPEHRNATVTLVRAFGPGTYDSLSVQYNRLRREFYVKASPFIQTQFQTNSNIFVRDAEVIDVANQLNYTTGEASMFSLRGGLLSRTVQRSMYYEGSAGSEIANPRIQESQLYGGFSISHMLNEWASTSFNVSLSEREESHSSRILNNVSRRTAVTGNLFLALSDRDSLTFGGSTSILRYDTPDSMNTDDRDELFITLGIEEVHRFNRFLTLTLTADVSLNHLVYLHRFQSASNNWNRVIRLSPKAVYTPSPWFRTTIMAEVLANYTVYDFEERVASIRSFSFRQASWHDSTIVRAGGWEFVLLGGVRLSERGILRWKEFQERPENFFVDKDVWLQIFCRPLPAMRMGIGFRYFAQDRFKYSAGGRVLDLQLQNSGPTAVFQWFDHDEERVVIEGWRETQGVNGVSLSSIVNLTMRVSFGL
ncbi:MAG: hypothetical protein HY562_10960 [Ignavibacteriales bacterium]|nr:hypothetical protein [Ignavibacteriales bacterium]